ncbi:anti-sigma factor [Actinophytocola sp.]|jgi:hypothetical protein|uniref:anti-sigma factor n=1 Tax=Actinophytocola sp. TaxID=1872138 RepID=UPI002ED821CA
MSKPDHAASHVDVGAYVLGILDPPDEAAFADHFAGCAHCRAEYRELADLPRLLDQLKEEPAASEGALAGALAEISSARRKRGRNLWLAAAAVGVLLVSVPLVVWRAGNSGDAPPVAGPTVTVSAPAKPSETTAVAGARTLTATDPATNATAILTVDGDSSSTTVDLRLFAVAGPAKGELTAVTRTGHRELVTPWEMGVDQPSSEERGTVEIPMREIVGFELRQTAGPVKMDFAT